MNNEAIKYNIVHQISLKFYLAKSIYPIFAVHSRVNKILTYEY